MPVPTPTWPVHALSAAGPEGPEGERAHAVLLTVLADVRAWASRPVGERGAIALSLPAGFDEEVPGLEFALATLARLAGDARPPQVRSSALARVCLSAAAWARARGCEGTAVAFADAGARAWACDGADVEAARVALACGDPAAARPWLRHALARGRCRVDAELLREALMVEGDLRSARGDAAGADRAYRLAGELADAGDEAGQGNAALARAAATLVRGCARDAAPLARQGLERVAACSPRARTLAIVAAEALMERLDAYGSAAAVFRALLLAPRSSAEHLHACAGLAHAAAGLGWEDAFDAAWREAWTLVSLTETGAAQAAALLHLAQGARLLELDSRARPAAMHALRVARARGQTGLAARADRLLRAPAGNADPPSPPAASCDELRAVLDTIVSRVLGMAAE
jgi:hypothetical protein